MAGQEPRPILGASAAVFRGNDVLLVKRGKPPGAGLWSLPGGKVRRGETVLEAAIRELGEETGVVANLQPMAGFFEIITDDVHFVIACHAGLWRSGAVIPGDDAEEARFVPLAEVATLALAPHTARAIAEARLLLAV